MNIPFFDLKRQYEDIREEVERAVPEVMRSTSYIEGEAVKTFEKEMEEYLDVDHVITCGNGTDALRIALQAAGVSQGDEVITTPFTFFATAEAISQTGANPVFVDIDEKTLNINAALIAERLNHKTKAILPVHIFGTVAEMDNINKLASEYGIPVIEDACQAIGAEYHEKKAGALGDMGCFSFYPTKNLGAFGDGGMIVTNNEMFAQSCAALKAHAAGQSGAIAYQNIYNKQVEEIAELNTSGNSLYDPCKYFNYLIGGNSRLDSIQAAILSVKLRNLNRYNTRRTAIADRYRNELSGLELQMQEPGDHQKSCYHQFPILVKKRDEFAEYMRGKGVGTGAFYPVPLHLQRAYEGLSYQRGSLPVAESVCERSVCLPMYPELKEEEVTYIIDCVIKWCNQQ